MIAFLRPYPPNPPQPGSASATPVFRKAAASRLIARMSILKPQIVAGWLSNSVLFASHFVTMFVSFFPFILCKWYKRSTKRVLPVHTEGATQDPPLDIKMR